MTRENKVEKMIHAGLANIFASQDEVSFNKFAIITLEALMLLE